MGRRLGRRAARADQRRMQPRVVATNADEVVVLYQQRGLNPQGESDRSPVLALYELPRPHADPRADFYFGTAALLGLDPPSAERCC